MRRNRRSCKGRQAQFPGRRRQGAALLRVNAGRRAQGDTVSMPWKPLIAAVLISLAFPPPCGAQGNISSESSAAVREKAIEALIQGDYERSLEILEPLAHAGDPIAQYVMGYAHEEGLGREPDLEAAVRWYKRAAEGGHLEAMVRLCATACVSARVRR